MTGQQDPAAAGDDQLRAGDAHREQVIETLKTAFVHGLLTKDELDTRAGQALSARTRADLAALTADISAGPPAVPSARPPARARRRRPLARAATSSGACLAFAFGVVFFAANVLDPNGLGNPYHPWSSLCLVAALAAVCTAVFIAGNGVATALEQRRSRRRLPRGPGPGRHGLDGEQRGGAGCDPVPPGPRDGQAFPAELRARESRRRRGHVPARTARAPRGGRSARGAA